MSVTAPQEETLDYEHFVDYQLAHAQGRIKTVDVGTGVLRLISGAIAYVLAVIVLDHAVVLPAAARLWLLWAVLLAACAYIGLAVVLPGVRRISGFYAARTIEQATPEFQNSLINYLDLRRRPDEIPPGVLAALEDRAVSDLRRVQVDEKISHERLMRAGYGLAAAVVAACLAVLVNALFMHRSLVDSLGRVFLPTAEIAPPTKTQIIDVKPGDDADLNRVVASSDVRVSAISDGRVPERVTLHWSDDGGNFWREQDLTPPERQFDPWQLRIPLVEKSFDYYLVGGDCRTKTYRLEVTPAPMVTDMELTYEYPEYTRLPRYTNHNGNIDALEGTWVTLKATANRPVRSGELRFGQDKGRSQPMQRVTANEDQLSARFQVVAPDDSYVIWFKTDQGETNPRPARYDIKVRADRAPEVRITKPGTDLVDPPRPANAVVPLAVEARDDFAIDAVKLFVQQGERTLATRDLTAGTSVAKEFKATHRLDLADLELAAGTEISYYVEAVDNRMVDLAGGRQLTKNRTETPHYRIRVSSPLEPAERQLELARADDAEKAAAEAADQPPKDTAEPMPAAAPGDEPKQPSDSSAPPVEVAKEQQAIEQIVKYFEDKGREQQRGQSGEDEENRPTRGSESMDRGNDAKQPDENPATQPKDPERTQGDESGTRPNAADNEGDQPQTERTKGSKGQDQDPKDRTGKDSQGSSRDGDAASRDKPGERPDGAAKGQSGKGAPKPQQGERSNESSNHRDGQRTQPGDASGKKPGDPQGKSGGRGQEEPTSGDEKGTPHPGAAPGKTQPGDSNEAAERQRGGPNDPAGKGQQSGKTSDPGESPRDAAEPQKPGDGSSEKPTAPAPGKDLQGKEADGAQTDGQAGASQKSTGAKPGSKTGNQGGSSNPGDQSGGGKPGGPKSDGNSKPSGDSSRSGSKPGSKPGEDQPGDSGEGKPGKEPSDAAAGKKPGEGQSKKGSRRSGDADTKTDKSQGGERESQDSPTNGQGGNSKPGGDSKPSGDSSRSGSQAGSKSGNGQSARPSEGKGDKESGEGASKDGSGDSKEDGSKGGQSKGGDQGEQGGGSKGQSGGEKPGDSGSKGGESGSSPGAGSKPSSTPGSGSQAGSSTPGQGAPTQSGSSPSGGGNTGPGEVTAKPQPGAGPKPGKGKVRENGNDEPATSGPTPDAPNQMYTREVVDLVLQRVGEQLDSGKVDPELLDRLGWTQDELEQFVKRFGGPGKTDLNDATDIGTRQQKKPTETGKTTLKQPSVRTTRRGPGQTAAPDAQSSNFDAGRVPPPPQYRDAVDAYTKSQSTSEKAPAAAKPKTK